MLRIRQISSAISLKPGNNEEKSIPLWPCFLNGHGLGITLLPEFEQQQPGYQDLRTLRVTGPGVSREVGFITRPDMPLSRPASVLMDLIAAQFQVVAQRAERIGTGTPERPA